ncbi:MAG: hypothetical protein H7263_08565 [Candidatus Sericytochromatia bacterium]|nr:hypothetical protein [Candidatus Sericytochromatia bacterium]
MNEFNLTKEQSRRVKDHNLDYFKDNNFCPETKQNILNYAVRLGKIDIIKYYIEQGVKVTSSSAISDLMRRNAKIDTLEYLESKGVEIATNVFLLVAIKAQNLKFSQFLAPKVTDFDSFSLKTSIKFSIESFLDLPKASKVFDCLLKKISSEDLNQLLSEIDDNKFKDKKTFVFNEFLKIHLPDNKVKTKRIKI